MRHATHCIVVSLVFCALGMSYRAEAQVLPQVLPIQIPPPTTPLGPLGAQPVPPGCPAAPNQINFAAVPTVTFDSGTGMWTYNYTLANLATSQHAIAHFAIDFAPPISGVVAPAGWVTTTFDGRNTLYWSSVGGGAFPVGVTDTGGLPPSSADVQPGASISGFSFKSPNAPDGVPDYVLGYAPLPSAQNEEDVEAISTQCRQTTGNFFDLAVRGVVLGPAASYVPIEISVLPYQGGNLIDLSVPGFVAVAILSNAVHSALQVNPLTASFGPAGAPSLISPTSLIQDVNGDGLLDLILFFDKAATGILCGAGAASLVANLIPTGQVQGTSWVTTVNCTP